MEEKDYMSSLSQLERQYRQYPFDPTHTYPQQFPPPYSQPYTGTSLTEYPGYMDNMATSASAKADAYFYCREIMKMELHMIPVERRATLTTMLGAGDEEMLALGRTLLIEMGCLYTARAHEAMNKDNYTSVRKIALECFGKNAFNLTEEIR